MKTSFGIWVNLLVTNNYNLSIMNYQWQEALPLHTEQHTRWQQAMFDPQTASSRNCPIIAVQDIWWYHAQELLQKSSFTRL